MPPLPGFLSSRFRPITSFSFPVVAFLSTLICLPSQFSDAHNLSYHRGVVCVFLVFHSCLSSCCCPFSMPSLYISSSIARLSRKRIIMHAVDSRDTWETRTPLKRGNERALAIARGTMSEHYGTRRVRKQNHDRKLNARLRRLPGARCFKP